MQSDLIPSLPGPRRRPLRLLETNPSSSLFRHSLPRPGRRPPRSLETSPSSRLFRPTLPGPRRCPPCPLETSPSFRLSRRQHRRQQASSVSAPARTRADQTPTSRQGRLGDPNLRPARPVPPPQRRVDVPSSSASDPPSSLDRESCCWAGAGGAGDTRCQVT